jgi:uncharacterized protein YjbI with pentapeptide repeats
MALHGRGSYEHAPRGRVSHGIYLTGVYLTGMHLTGMHLTGVCLMGMHLTGVYLAGVSHLRVFLARRTRAARILISIPKDV